VATFAARKRGSELAG